MPKKPSKKVTERSVPFDLITEYVRSLSLKSDDRTVIQQDLSLRLTALIFDLKTLSMDSLEDVHYLYLIRSVILQLWIRIGDYLDRNPNTVNIVLYGLYDRCESYLSISDEILKAAMNPYSEI